MGDIVTLVWLAGFVLIEIDQRLLGGDPFGLRPERIDLTRARTMLLLFAVIGAYEVVPSVTRGVTLGKALFGLRVCRADGAPLGPAYALVRTIMLYGPTLFLGAIGAAFDLVLLISVVIPASGRGLHDRVAASIVVSRDQPPE